jgi:hypothetical protein
VDISTSAVLNSAADTNSSPLYRLSSAVDPDTAAGMLIMQIAEFADVPFGSSLVKLRSVIEAIEAENVIETPD